MVKVTVGEMSYEGTAEEIKELLEVLGAEFPNTSEAEEDYEEEVSEDLPVGTKIKVKTDGRSMTLSERKPKHDRIGYGKAYGLKGLTTWLGEDQFEVVEDSEEATKPSFTDGDIAVVTGGTNCGGIGKGVKVRITRAELDEDGELRISLLDGSDFDWAKPEALSFHAEYAEEIEEGDIIRREGKLHEVEGVREPGYMCSSEGLTTTDGRWMFIDTVELVAKKSDRKDI